MKRKHGLEIEFDPAAAKEFARLGSSVRRDMQRYLDALSGLSDPRSRGKPLRGGMKGLWHYRVDKYRILCKLEEKRLVIFIIAVGKRDTIYD